MEKVYQNHHLDSTQWNKYIPRDDDIVLVTSIKSGTTWMQYILTHLVFKDVDQKPKTIDVSPWLDERRPNIDSVVENLESQEHRRFIKSHLPFDGIPYYENIKYIVVARDTRDVFMSLWNHYRNLTPVAYKSLNQDCFNNGEPPFPECPKDIKEFWNIWLTRGWFEWECEGYPFWSNIRHTQTWWEHRNKPNILFVHFSDLLNDPSQEINCVANYLNINLSKEDLATIVTDTSFNNMKKYSNTFLEKDGSSFHGGGDTFIHKGTNGRWKSCLSTEDLSIYHGAVSRILSPECLEWLER